MSDLSDDDDSDRQLNLLLKQMRSAQTPVENLPHEGTEMLARLRRIPADVQAEQTSFPAEDCSTLPFQQIGQYELLERIAGGGMGEVFKARHQKLGNVVAIKLLHRDRVVDRQLLDRFEQEMRAVGRLNHEHIVRPLYADEQDGIPYLVLEHVEGQTLAAVLNEYAAAGEVFPIALACESIRQAAIGLAHAHQHGIIHRDIKPANLMLTWVAKQLVAGQPVAELVRVRTDADPIRILTNSATNDGRPSHSVVLKILDLGLARLNEPASDDKQPHKQDLTREGQVMGTPDYMAPEQLENSHQVDARTDIYALGATLFKLLTGRAPYADAGDGSLTAKLLAITCKPTPAVSQFRSDLPPDLEALIQRMLSKSRNDRPQTAMEVAEALSPFAGEVGRVLLPVAADVRARVPILLSRRWSTSVRMIMSLIALGLCIALGLMIRNLTSAGKHDNLSSPAKPNVTASGPTSGQRLGHRESSNTTMPTAQSADPDRAAAEWLLSLQAPAKVTFLIQSPVINWSPESNWEKWMSPGESLPGHDFRVIFVQIWSITALTDQDINRWIVPLRSLRHLQLDFSGGFTEAAVPMIKRCTMLHELGLALTPISGPACLKLFLELPNLKSVLISNDQFTDEMSDYFRSTPKITGVTLHNGGDSQLRQLMSAKQLTRLVFITASSVETATWRELAIQLPKLEVVGANTSNFNTADLIEIARCSNLRELWIQSNPITDTDLLTLHSLRHLTLLNLSQTKVTKPGVRDLHEHLPNCRITWDGGVIEPAP